MVLRAELAAAAASGGGGRLVQVNVRWVGSRPGEREDSVGADARVDGDFSGDVSGQWNTFTFELWQW